MNPKLLGSLKNLRFFMHHLLVQLVLYILSFFAYSFNNLGVFVFIGLFKFQIVRVEGLLVLISFAHVIRVVRLVEISFIIFGEDNRRSILDITISSYLIKLNYLDSKAY
jgi:hypothetical protein